MIAKLLVNSIELILEQSVNIELHIETIIYTLSNSTIATFSYNLVCPILCESTNYMR